MKEFQDEFLKKCQVQLLKKPVDVLIESIDVLLDVEKSQGKFLEEFLYDILEEFMKKKKPKKFLKTNHLRIPEEGLLCVKF